LSKINIRKDFAQIYQREATTRVQIAAVIAKNASAKENMCKRNLFLGL